MNFLPFAALVLALPLHAAENLLVNPEFKDGKNGVPNGWKIYSTGLAAPKVVTLPDGSAALELADEDKDKGGGLRQQVACEPGAKYELSCEALPVEGKEMGRVLIQISGQNLVLAPGRNTLGITAAKSPLQIYVWTAKHDVGHARVRGLALKKVDAFGPETAVDGKRPRPAKPAKSAAPAEPGELRVTPKGGQCEFTIGKPGIYRIDVIQISVLDGEAELGLFQTGDVGDPGNVAQGVDLKGLDQELAGQVGGQELIASAEVSGRGGDSAEAFIGLAGHGAHDGIAVEIGLGLDLGLFLGHAGTGTAAALHSENGLLTLLFHVVGLLQNIDALGQLVHLLLLGLDLLDRGVGVGGLLVDVVGDAFPLILQSEDLFFHFEQGHF